MRRKKMAIGIAVVVVLVVCGVFYACCHGHAPASVPEVAKRPKGRVLIVCYSQSNTKSTLTMGRWIQQMTGGNLMEIEPVNPYPDGYAATVKQAYGELKEKFKPALKPLDKTANDYDIVFLGTPVWFGTFAPPVRSFLAESNLSGKKVIPFCTHGGGGASHTFADLAAELPGATLLEGLALRGPNVVQRKMGKGLETLSYPEDVRQWLMKLDLGWEETTK
ncbi:MAG: NAD(P)H-dependent oxidoreductase [Victivallales bacterium]|nr:NAD(P)H-dependent oxidoreductase [Victivallales bacterium]